MLTIPNKWISTMVCIYYLLLRLVFCRNGREYKYIYIYFNNQHIYKSGKCFELRGDFKVCCLVRMTITLFLIKYTLLYIFCFTACFLHFRFQTYVSCKVLKYEDNYCLNKYIEIILSLTNKLHKWLKKKSQTIKQQYFENTNVIFF